MIPLPATEQPPSEKLFDQTAVMVMRKGDSIQGRVTDATGQPIANAAIHDSEYYWNGSTTPRAKTDGEGNLRIAGIKSATEAQPTWAVQGVGVDSGITLTVQAPGYAPELITAARPNSPLEIQLEPGHSVQGRVVDQDGKPVEGATIYARQWRGNSNRLHLEAKSDADGNFRLSDMPADEVKYDVSKDGYMVVEDFAMSPSADTYLVTLKAPVTIIGSVVDVETGKPLEKFLLREGIDYGDGRAPDWMLYRTKTISNGKYELKIIQEGFRYRVRVEADGYMPGESRVFRAYDPDQGEITYDFKLKKAPPLTGTVHDRDGKPLADASVYLVTERLNIVDRKVSYAGSNRTVKSDEAGRFEFPPEVEPFCLVSVHEQGIAMINDEDFKRSVPLTIQPWTNTKPMLQIIRRPAPGQSVDFPSKYP
jgi:protocatechuate 3,4-dioxygenase beta subunit